MLLVEFTVGEASGLEGHVAVLCSVAEACIWSVVARGVYLQ